MAWICPECLSESEHSDDPDHRCGACGTNGMQPKTLGAAPCCCGKKMLTNGEPLIHNDYQHEVVAFKHFCGTRVAHVVRDLKMLLVKALADRNKVEWKVERLEDGIRNILGMCENCTTRDEYTERLAKLLDGDDVRGKPACAPCAWAGQEENERLRKALKDISLDTKATVCIKVIAKASLRGGA